jgi:ribonuclease R
MSSEPSLTRKILEFLQKQRKSVRPVRIAHHLGVSQDDPVFADALLFCRRVGTVYAGDGKHYANTRGLDPVIGKISITRQGFAFVQMPDGSEVFIPEGYCADAIQGDTVAVQKQGRRSRSRSGLLEAGHVLGVAERPERTIPGVCALGTGFAWITPDDQSLPEMHLVGTEGTELQNGHKVIARLQPLALDSSEPRAELERILGNPSDPDVSTEAIIAGFGLSTQHSPEAIAQADAVPEEVGEVSPDRLDLRDLEIVTIDPAEAADIDDAVSLTTDDEGRQVVGIHIADVSHYVTPGDAIDREAHDRGTSVYLPGNVLHMLPNRLSQGICSLNPNVERFAVSVLVTLDRQMHPVSHKITRSLIRSRAKLSYENVEAVLDGDAADDCPALPHADMLRAIAKITARMTAHRMEAGALDFDLPEVQVVLDDEGRVRDLRRRERLRSHRLIEELALLANRVVASELSRARMPTLYRVHGRPDPTKLGDVASLASALGHTLGRPGASPSVSELRKFMSDVDGTPVGPILQRLIVRSLPKALYQPENIGHFGLAAKEYLHFTSPIRRYPDLIVHRQLMAHLSGKPAIYTASDLVVLGMETSASEQNAEKAERSAIHIRQAEFLAQYAGERVQGTISGAHKGGIFVSLNDTLADGYVSVSDLPNDSWRFDPVTLSVTGTRTRHRYQFGDPVEVQIARVDVQSGDIELIITHHKPARSHVPRPKSKKDERRKPKPGQTQKKKKKRKQNVRGKRKR